MLSYGLERKEGFEDDKNVNFKKFKKQVFAKDGFGQKIQNFFQHVFSNLGLEIMLSYSPERKEGFENNKNVNF